MNFLSHCNVQKPNLISYMGVTKSTVLSSGYQVVPPFINQETVSIAIWNVFVLSVLSKLFFFSLLLMISQMVMAECCPSLIAVLPEVSSFPSHCHQVLAHRCLLNWLLGFFPLIVSLPCNINYMLLLMEMNLGNVVIIVSIQKHKSQLEKYERENLQQ